MEMTQELTAKLPSYASVFDKDRGIISFNADETYPAILAELNMEPDQYSVEIARRCVTHDILAVTGPGLHLKIVGDGKFAIKKMPENEKHGSNSASIGAASFMRHYIDILVKRRAAIGIESEVGKAIKEQLYGYGVILSDSDNGTTWRRA